MLSMALKEGKRKISREARTAKEFNEEDGGIGGCILNGIYYPAEGEIVKKRTYYFSS